MIVELLLNAVCAVLGGLVSLLPSGSPPDFSGAADAIHEMTASLGWLNYYFPVDVILVLVGVQIAITLGLHGYHLVAYLLTKAHIVGGAD